MGLDFEIFFAIASLIIIFDQMNIFFFWICISTLAYSRIRQKQGKLMKTGLFFTNTVSKLSTCLLLVVSTIDA